MKAPTCGVIFDMDGVLADTARAHFESWLAVGRKWNARITWEDFERTFGRPNHQIIPEMLHREVPEAELKEIDRFKEAAFRDIIRQELEPLPGVVELIRGLHGAGFRLAVGSSGPRENIDLVLDVAGVASFHADDLLFEARRTSTSCWMSRASPATSAPWSADGTSNAASPIRRSS